MKLQLTQKGLNNILIHYPYFLLELLSISFKKVYFVCKKMHIYIDSLLSLRIFQRALKVQLVILK